MVEAKPAPNAERLPFNYGVFRSDKPADPGYSRELMNINIDNAHYDNFEQLPELNNPTNSIIDVFYKAVREKGNRHFLGTRPLQANGSYGPYEWMSYQDVFNIYEEIAKGSRELNLFNPILGIDEDNK